jgi:tetratricopeptide (TPR) repeat protein
VKRAAAGGWIVYQSGGGVVPVAADQVSSIELTPPANLSTAQAMERLDGLRSWCAGTHEPAAAIRRYDSFIAQIKEPTALAAAKADLSVWQDRQQCRMVKVGQRWFDPKTDHDALVTETTAQADAARQLLKQGQSTQADPLLSEAVAADPHNATALYLLALVRLDQDDLPGARKSLDALMPLAMDHAPTLNNLAVVQWRQNQWMAALSSYQAALAAAPVELRIVDNVGAALAAFPSYFRSTPIYTQVMQDYQRQQQLLAQRMAGVGLVRYGSAWIPLAQRQQIEAQQKLARQQLNQLAAAFDAAAKTAEDIDRDILQAESQLRSLQLTALVQYNPYGLAPQPLPLAMPAPLAYTNLQQDLQLQQQRRNQQAGLMATMRQTAIDLQKQLAPPPNDLTQVLFGVEATPFIPEPAGG